MSERAISTVMIATGSVRIDAGYVGTKTVKEFTASTNMKIVGFLMYYGQDSPLVGTDFDVQFMLVKAGQVLEVQKEGNLTYTPYGHMRWAVGSKTTMLPSGCYLALNAGQKLQVDVYAENTGGQARYCSCDITLFYY